MIIDKTLGPAAPEHGWVPAPRYLLRRALILRELHTITPCDTLEIGPGPGMLLHELDAHGFHCRALEMSAAAREVADSLAREAGRDIQFLKQPEADWPGHFGLVMAFEVLEHIEHDLEALRQWRSWLQPGGTLLLSVPCHMNKWSPSDVWAGRFRRYERAQLTELTHTAGFDVEQCPVLRLPIGQHRGKNPSAQSRCPDQRRARHNRPRQARQFRSQRYRPQPRHEVVPIAQKSARETSYPQR